MGSFNTTCFASNQTIATDDKCRVIAIRQSSTYHPVSLIHEGKPSEQFGITSSTCYPGAFWEPVGEFIEAEYNDYGSVTLVPTDFSLKNIMFLIEELNNSTAETLQGENDSHDIPFNLSKFLESDAPLVLAVLDEEAPLPLKEKDPDEFEKLWDQVADCWQHVWDVTQEHRLFSAGVVDGHLRPLQFAIVHEAAFSQLVQIGLNVNSPEEATVKQRQLFVSAKEMAQTSAKKYKGSTGDPMFAMKMARQFDRLGGSEGLRNEGNAAFAEALLEAFGNKEISEQECFDQLQPWMAGRHAVRALEALNLKLQPMVYAAQDYQNEMGQMYAKFVNSVSATVTAERNANNDDSQD